MRLVTRDQALEIDRMSQIEYDLSGEKLMEEAGKKTALKIIQLWPFCLDGEIAVVCGPGNNGGDAAVVARHLLQSGAKKLFVYLPDSFDESSTRDASRLLGIQVAKLRSALESLKDQADVTFRPHSEFPRQMPSGSFVIDGIFGVGLNRDIIGDYKKIIQKINSTKTFILSLDVPSGLNVDTGRLRGCAIRAAATLTIYPAKLGFYLRDGPDHVGQIQIIKIAFPSEVIHSIAQNIFLMSPRVAAKWWPKRGADSNKSKFGKAYIVAGSPGKWGAAVLAARSAFRAGAGYVVHASGARNASSFRGEVPEAMSIELKNILSEIKKSSKHVAIAIGPGTGFGKDLFNLIVALHKTSNPVVLDADALTILSKAEAKTVARKHLRLPPHWILTPHSGELSRLINWNVEKIEADPVAAAKFARNKWGCTIVLKGFYTVVVSGVSGKVIVVPKGNVALAKAGTGDVLTGLIVGLLAQGIYPLKACLLAVYLHGATADDWVKENSAASLSASDLVDLLPRSMKFLEER